MKMLSSASCRMDAIEIHGAHCSVVDQSEVVGLYECMATACADNRQNHPEMLSQAFVWIDLALSLDKRGERTSSLWTTKGRLLSKQGKGEEAVICMKLALYTRKVGGERDDVEKACCLGNVGEMLTMAGKWDEAVMVLLEAKMLWEKGKGDILEIVDYGMCLYHLGLIRMSRRDSYAMVLFSRANAVLEMCKDNRSSLCVRAVSLPLLKMPTCCYLLDCLKEGTKRCSSCKGTLYCSVEHQLDDWKFHKYNCVHDGSETGK
jgi:hypothetical protein